MNATTTKMKETSDESENENKESGINTRILLSI